MRSVKVNDIEQWNATYTKNGEVKVLEDKVIGKTEKNYFDKYGRKFAYIIKDGIKIPYKEEYSYDDYGNVLKTTFGDRAYAYTYDTDSARTLKGVSTGGVSFEKKTDKVGRNAGKVITQGSTEIAKESIRYLKFGDRATNLPFAVDFKDGRITYKYDKVGNIKEIRENGEIVAKYRYDTLGRLVREDNKPFNSTVTYTYDNCGNILEKRTYAYTLVDDIEEKEHTTVSYKYDGDVMLKYGAEACSYDVLGNPTTYRGKTATWEKGKLKTYNGVTLGYDGRGKRISSGSLTFEYSSDGKLLKRSDGLEFIYDTQGIAGVVDNSGSTVKTYFYRKDAQGNIVALLDENGSVVVKYVYNAWGEHKVLNPDGTENTSASFIGNLNPFRYRGYYYDTALKLYYLVTRYYDPVVGRFISQDAFDYADPDTINGLNLYAYCANNPVMNVDPMGTSWLSDLWNGFKSWMKNTFSSFLDVSKNVVSFARDYLFFGWEEGVKIGGTIGDDSKPVSFYLTNASEWWKFWEYQLGLKVNISDFSFSLSLGLGELNTSLATKDSSFDFQLGINKIGFGISKTIDGITSYKQYYIRTIPTLFAIFVATLGFGAGFALA